MPQSSLSLALPSLRGTPQKALMGATVGFFIGFGAVSLFGPTAQSFVAVMHLSPLQVGFLVAIPMLTGSLLRIPFGAWVDTTGGKKPFLVLLVLSVIGIAGLYYMLLRLYPDHLTQGHYPWLLFFGALGGCGIATFSVGIGQVSYWFPRKTQGLALAAYAGLGNTSPGLVAIVLPLMITFIGLWGAYLVSLAIVIVGIGLYLGLGRNAPYFQLRAGGADMARSKDEARRAGQELFPQASAMQALAEAARTWRTWPLVLLYFTTFGGFLALTAWFPTYWQNFFGASRWTVVGLTAGFSLIASLIRVPGGSWSDRFGGEAVATLSLVVLLIGAALLTFSENFSLSVLGTLLVACGMGVNNAAVFRMVPDYVPNAVGGAAGWIGGLGALSGFVLPPLLGWFVAGFGVVGYARGFAAFIALAIMSLLLTALLRNTRRSNSHRSAS